MRDHCPSGGPGGRLNYQIRKRELNGTRSLPVARTEVVVGTGRRHLGCRGGPRRDPPYGPGQLAAMISVSVVSDTQLLRLSVESSDPALASEIANTAASVFIEQNTENQLSRPGDASIG